MHLCSDDVESHQLVLDSMPLLLVMFTSRQTSTQMTVQLLRTLSLVCHRNRVAQVTRRYRCLSVSLSLSVCLSVCLAFDNCPSSYRRLFL